MKKMTKRIVALLMVTVLISVFALPVAAAERKQRELEVGETMPLMLSHTPYQSSDSNVMVIEHNGNYSYTARAVGEGFAVISGGSWNGAMEDEYAITVTAESAFDREFNQTKARIERTHDVMEVVLPILAVVMSALLVAAIVYIFIAAPKCGMSRWWALVPLFSHVIGLVVFIVIRSERQKNGAGANTFRCPTCSAVHPYGTAVCSVCGKKFY